MFVNIFGEKTEVEVSDGGMFYDKATKTISAKTLKGLEKKLREARPQNTQGIPIEDINGKKGVVLGRVANTRSYWRRRYFRVRWENDTTVAEATGDSLRRRTTDEEKAEVVKLETAASVASKAAQDASTKCYVYKAKFSAAKDLDTSFPLN